MLQYNKGKAINSHVPSTRGLLTEIQVSPGPFNHYLGMEAQGTGSSLTVWLEVVLWIIKIFVSDLVVARLSSASIHEIVAR